ncbi:MAG: ABC transporter ATP-binding protein [Anaerolineaceae bacterium]|nr:MAG: ABC transporter ATP-binding protein [Anaerolineaceae bacterium]
MIELTQVTYSYPQTARLALNDLSINIPAGQFCAVVGPNGAGKSTFCYTLTGFSPHYYRGQLEGSVRVAGCEIPEVSLGELAGQVGLVFSNPFNQISGTRFSVREEIAFGLENMGIPRAEMQLRVEEVLALTGLERLAERSPYALSGGQQQRVALASVLVMRPPVLVLDEPTSQLDPLGKKEVFAVLDALSKRKDTTVVLVERELEWIASFAERVLVMDSGQIVADGRPQNILASEALQALGVGNTRYTVAARQAVAHKLATPAEPMPVTLAQTREFLSK